METIDLARRLKRRFPQSLRSMTARGLAQVLDTLPEQDIAELESRLDERDARELRRVLSLSELSPPGRPEKALRALRVIDE
jgi:hypothetical protein